MLFYGFHVQTITQHAVKWRYELAMLTTTIDVFIIFSNFQIERCQNSNYRSGKNISIDAESKCTIYFIYLFIGHLEEINRTAH